jgi:predicted phosphodiesterase
MQIQLLSDLHLEFHKSTAKEWVASVPVKASILVLAGDIVTPAMEYEPIGWFCERFQDVIYIPGNHDFYGSSVARVLERTAQLPEKHKNLHVLQNNAETIQGQRFYGGTMWFPEPVGTAEFYKTRMNDYHCIAGIHQVYEQHERFRKGLAECDANTVVVSHHLPTEEAVSQAHKGDPINHFFAAEVAPLAPAVPLWLFGHTHDSKDFIQGDTRFVCNPRGYFPDDVNKNFNQEVVIESTRSAT